MRKILILACWACPAIAAAASFGMLPARSPDLFVRFNHGAPVLISVMPHGIVQISPVKSRLDGRLQVSVVAYNSGPSAANLGYENIRIASADGGSLELYGYDHLRHEANKHATIARVGLILSAAVNGYATGQESRYHPVAAAIDRGRAEDDEVAWAQLIQDRLDVTMEHLDGDVLQTTTIDPGQVAGGEVVAGKPRFTNGLSPRYDMTVTFNGETHLISFYAAREGAAVPPADEYVPISEAGLKTLMAAAAPVDLQHPSQPDQAAPQPPGDTYPAKGRAPHTTLASQTSHARRHTAGLVILGGAAQ